MGTNLKNLIDSNITEKIIPIVVMIAIKEHIISPIIISFSTAFLARKSIFTKLKAYKPKANEHIIVIIDIKLSECPRQIINFCAKSIIHRSGSPTIIPSAILFIAANKIKKVCLPSIIRLLGSLFSVSYTHLTLPTT